MKIKEVIQKCKENIKQLNQEVKEVKEYEKTKKIYWKVNKALIKVIYILLIIMIFLAIIGKSCKPTMLKAATNTIPYYVTTQEGAFTKTQIGNDVYLEGTEVIENTTQVVKLNIYGKYYGTDNKLMIVIASNSNIEILGVANHGFTAADWYRQTTDTYGSTYAFYRGNQPTLILTTPNNSEVVDYEIAFSVHYTSGVVAISTLIIPTTSTSSLAPTPTLKASVEMWVNQRSEIWSGTYINFEENVNNAFIKGYNLGMKAADQPNELKLMMETIFNYPINFFNTMLDFNYKGMWVGQLFYFVVFLGFGFIAIKIFL